MTDSTPETTPAPSAESVENSVSLPEPEAAAPRKTRKPAAPSAVVTGGPSDPVYFARVSDPRTNKSLTIHHLQRRLVELGHLEAGSDIDGRLGLLTTRSISAWQKEQKLKETGVLTREQFASVFQGDPNVHIAD